MEKKKVTKKAVYDDVVINAIKRNFGSITFGGQFPVRAPGGNAIDMLQITTSSSLFEVISIKHGSFFLFSYQADASNCGFGGVHRFVFNSASTKVGHEARKAIFMGALRSISGKSAVYYTSNNEELTEKLINIGFERVYEFINDNSNKRIDVLIIKLR